MNTPIFIPMTVAADKVTLPVTAGTQIIVNRDPEYAGAHEFTPGDSTQIVPVGGYRMTQDIIIDPIPSNYGKITWNGAVLTVS